MSAYISDNGSIVHSREVPSFVPTRPYLLAWCETTSFLFVLDMTQATPQFIPAIARMPKESVNAELIRLTVVKVGDVPELMLRPEAA